VVDRIVRAVKLPKFPVDLAHPGHVVLDWFPHACLLVFLAKSRKNRIPAVILMPLYGRDGREILI